MLDPDKWQGQDGGQYQSDKSKKGSCYKKSLTIEMPVCQ